MADWLVVAAPLLLLWPPLRYLSNQLPLSERRVVGWVVGAHLLGMVLLIIVVQFIYRSGDMLSYHRSGTLIAKELHKDFGLFVDVGRLIVNRPSELDALVFGQDATRTMCGFAALLEFAFFQSLPAVCTAVAMGSASAKLALYVTFRPWFHPSLRDRLAVAVLLIPSYVFWSSGLLKEGIAVTGFGWSVWALAPFVGLGTSRRTLVRIIVAAPALAIVGYTKPYLLFPLALAAAAAWFVAWQRRTRGAVVVTPFRLAVAVIGAVAVTAALDVVFPRFSSDTIVDQAATIRRMGSLHQGGSSFTPTAPVSGGLAAHLLYSPLAVANVLFRPFLFEARNLLMAMSAAETTVFLVLFWKLAARTTARRLVRSIIQHPVLAFCATYVLTFSVAVGFSTTNMGSLARYRSPMLPFLGLLLFGLWQVGNNHPRNNQPRPPPPSRRATRSAEALTRLGQHRR